ncbi:hypothetical protein JCM10213_002736 [Rhodosporidiobolus nylandii]
MSTVAEQALELQPTRSQASAAAVETGEPSLPPALDNKALWSLLAQHLSSSWGARCYEFASYLFLIQLFPDTTLQPSIFGFFTTGAAILFAGSVGHLVDIFPRLRFVRGTIVAQKVTVGLSYALFLLCFLQLDSKDGRERKSAAITGLFVVLTILSMALNLATIGISVAVERDWVTAIAKGDGAVLTRLNTHLRRIDLLSKLLAPLFVSLLTTAATYMFAAGFLLAFAAVTAVFEFFWINLVYRRIPALHPPPIEAPLAGIEAECQQDERPRERAVPGWKTRLSRIGLKARARLSAEGHDWLAFITAPVFFSSLAISLLYLTVLSFEGSMLAYLKSHSYADSYVAGMRGIGVVTGLMGTILMPVLEKQIGLVRAGSWSIISEVVTLVPALLAFFVGAPPDGKQGPAYNDALLFTGMALSRVGLWAFDLCQLKELQQALEHHPRKNSIMGLQFSLQNMLDLVKYVVTIVLSRPSQFKWAVVISFCSFALGAASQWGEMASSYSGHGSFSSGSSSRKCSRQKPRRSRLLCADPPKCAAACL